MNHQVRDTNSFSLCILKVAELLVVVDDQVVDEILYSIRV